MRRRNRDKYTRVCRDGVVLEISDPTEDNTVFLRRGCEILGDISIKFLGEIVKLHDSDEVIPFPPEIFNLGFTKIDVGTSTCPDPLMELQTREVEQ